ncbi:MAG: DotU family type IV/VI secretion system protein [Planctomycetota bacterium]
MNDTFAAKVYPTILYTLGLLDRIQSGRGPEPKANEEKPRLKQYLGQLDSRGSDQREFELAKAALTYWIDELLVNSRWSQANEWKNNTLERELYDARDRAWEFFEKAKAARSTGQANALETFYLCVALGFQGIYRDGEVRPAAGTNPPASPPPQVQAAPRKPLPTSDQVTWFNEKSGDSGRGDEQTWGFGDVQLPEPKSTPSAPPPPPVAPQPRSMGNTDLPKTLQEWSAPVYAQIAPGGLRSFVPNAAPDSQRDARPLGGWLAFKRSINLVILMGGISLILAIWGIL